MSTLCYHLQLEINFSAWNQRISLLVINVIEQKCAAIVSRYLHLLYCVTPNFSDRAYVAYICVKIPQSKGFVEDHKKHTGQYFK